MKNTVLVRAEKTWERGFKWTRKNEECQTQKEPDGVRAHGEVDKSKQTLDADGSGEAELERLQLTWKIRPSIFNFLVVEKRKRFSEVTLAVCSRFTLYSQKVSFFI